MPVRAYARQEYIRGNISREFASEHDEEAWRAKERRRGRIEEERRKKKKGEEREYEVGERWRKVVRRGRERWRERWKGIGSKVERRGRESGGKNQ